MRRRPFRSSALLLLVLGAMLLAALRLGLIPPRLSPLAPLALSEPYPWFLDFRLSALKHDPAACRSLLKAPIITAETIADNPIKKGCGWSNAERITSAAGIHAPIATLTCEMSAALALWLEYEVQPEAHRQFGRHRHGERRIPHGL